MNGSNNSEQDDDYVLWQRVTENVTPLDSVRFSHRATAAAASMRKAATPKKKKTKQAVDPTRPLPAPQPKAAPIDLRAGEHAAMDKSTRKKLFRGDVPLTARLDLHGLTAAQAESKLSRFITDSAHRGHRCVLVITGKGMRGDGVIRKSITGWLQKPALGALVLAIANARPSDGGTGAIYVLLRRRRP